MTLPRLCTRLAKLEAQRRPWVVADILRRARQCAPSELGMFLYTQMVAVDHATMEAIAAQLTEAEWDALIPPEMQAFLDTLPASSLAALAKGDPREQQRAWRAFQQWLTTHRP